MKVFMEKWSGSAVFEFAPATVRDSLMDAYKRCGKTPLGFAAHLGVDPDTFERRLRDQEKGQTRMA
jgi:hypothetical protein